MDIEVVGLVLDSHLTKRNLNYESLDYTIDMYGLVGQGFSLGPNYPVGYWSGALDAHARSEIKRTETTPNHMHIGTNLRRRSHEQYIRNYKKHKRIRFGRR